MKTHEYHTDCHRNCQAKEPQDEGDILSCPKYIHQASTVITKALKSGCDVVQMPNGDIVIREQKIVTTKFCWNNDNEKIIKFSTEIENQSTHI